ncbi:glycoside hydrolase 43 family protein [Streptomyces humidus]|uniref:Glycoside hydrolase 43 family protein n=1 Tax=Streptomyces humidus TaxID=52259 RepID=A0A918G7Q8_9ACTN|nr:glycoside hydrolase family 43 protein [Streptomyces humidus]GGS23710.1 glycoside hydrolase 43 family protein [Streptomyces humidus]
MNDPQRPVIPGFHPDPSICRVGDTYYLATSSFEYAPGVPVFRSTDLRSWEQIGNALDRPSQLDVSQAGPSGGVFAPTLRHHDGRFWMITTNWSDEGGQVLVHAEDPAGPWSDPVRIPSAVGIDPDLAWDDDGTCLMSYAGFGPQGGEGIVQSAIDPFTGEVLGERRWLWSGTGGKFPEGPHLYRVGDLWYLLVAEGGTERGHAVTIARGPSPRGPFESSPRNPVLTHRGTDLPVQNTGHADLVERPDGSWAIVYHGVRARGSSPEWHVLGRETFADEVIWEDGWPVPAGHIAPARPAETAVRQELTGQTLPPDWVAASRFPAEAVSREDAGWRVTAVGADPVFVGRRQEHLFAQVRARIVVEGTGGLSVRVDPRHALELEVADGAVEAVWAVGDVRHRLGRAELAGEADLELRMLPSQGHEFSTARGPDRVVAGVRLGDGFVPLGEVDGRYLSTEVAGGMTGRMVGLAATRGSVLVRSFEYLGSDDPAVVGGGPAAPVNWAAE